MTHDRSVQTGNEVTESVTSGTAPTPTHDPLCPQADPYSTDWEPWQQHWSCHCDLIAKVRDDTLDMAEQSIQSLTGDEMISMDATAWIMKSSAIKSINNLRGGYGKDPSSS